MKRYSKEIYSKEVLLKTAFAFTDSMYVHLDTDESQYLVELYSKTDDVEDLLYKRFENELIAQETRRIVAEKTKAIRELLVARSLSSTIVNTGLANPEVTNYEADEILTDWFDKNEK